MSLFTQELAFTQNGGVTNRTSGSAVLDLFAIVGASRGKNIDKQMVDAYMEDPVLATKVMLWSRDVRGGVGERAHFRNYLHALAKSNQELAFKVMLKIPEIGRFDDLKALLNTPLEKEALSLWFACICNGNGLAAKWFPRRGDVFVKTAKLFDFTPKELRRLVVDNSNTVEQAMCAKSWHEIDFSKLPSQAMLKYRKAFARNAEATYAKYLASLEKGEAKVNAGAVYPHEVYFKGKDTPSLLEGMWKALPNLVPEGVSFLPVIDTSGSMGYFTSTSRVNPIHIAVTLGMYLAERNTTEFKDEFITFSEQPKMVKLRGNSVASRLDNLSNASWGFNTNFVSTFQLIINKIKQNRIPQERVPQYLLVLSDMEFDRDGDVTGMQRAIQIWKQQLPEYKMPNVVFWNLNARAGNNPVTIHDTGVCMVSGYSPAIAKAVLSASKFDPMSVLLETVDVARYAL